MNNLEIAAMLTFISAIDGRIKPDEATVTAWKNVLHNEITSSWASDWVKRQISRSGDMIIPSMLNRAWDHHKDLRKANEIDAHCGRKGCRCTHRYCYKGWMDQDVDSSMPADVERDVRLLRSEGAGIGEIMQAIKGRVPVRHVYFVASKCSACHPVSVSMEVGL